MGGRPSGVSMPRCRVVSLVRVTLSAGQSASSRKREAMLRDESHDPVVVVARARGRRHGAPAGSFGNPPLLAARRRDVLGPPVVDGGAKALGQERRHPPGAPDAAARALDELGARPRDLRRRGHQLDQGGADGAASRIPERIDGGREAPERIARPVGIAVVRPRGPQLITKQTVPRSGAIPHQRQRRAVDAPAVLLAFRVVEAGPPRRRGRRGARRSRRRC